MTVRTPQLQPGNDDPASALTPPDGVTPSRPPAANVQLAAALDGALAGGPAALDQQLRYLLAYSQALGRRPTPNVAPEKPLTANAARLSMLVALVEENRPGAALGPEQIEQIAAEIAQLGDSALRGLLAARLAAFRAPQAQISVMRETLRWLSPALIAPAAGAPEYARAAPDDTGVGHAARARILHHLSLLHITDGGDSDSRPNIITELYRTAKAIGSAEGRLRSLAALAVHVPPASARKFYERLLADLVKVRGDALRSTTLVALTARVPPEYEADIIATALAIRAPATKARALSALAEALPERAELSALAVETVAAITDEDERLEAFANAAPGLKAHQAAYQGDDRYSPALKDALGIAIGFARRNARARALVLLAPYLTPDLQSEALAAVNGLPNERERAALLADLAPHLPARALASCLTMAHTMREQDSRAHVLSVIAHHLPPDAEARAQTLLDALAAATNLPSPFERVRALVALADVLPETLQHQALTSAVETARLIENDNARARALGLLAANVTPTLLRRVSEAVLELRDAGQRLNALAGIAQRTPAQARGETLDRLLETAQKLPFSYQRARAVTAIAPSLTPEYLERALALASSIQEMGDRASALIAVAQVQPPSARAATVAEAWMCVGKIEDGYDRASALVAVAPLLPPAQRPELEARIGMVVGGIMDDYDQASALCLLAPLMADVAPPREAEPLPSPDLLLAEAVFSALRAGGQRERADCLAEIAPTWAVQEAGRRFALWREAAQGLKSLPLADALLCLSALMPVIRAIADDGQMVKIAQILGVQGRKTDEPQDKP